MSPSTSGRRVWQRRNRNSDLESTPSNDLSGLVLATHAEVEANAEDDSVADITSLEARRWNGGWTTMEIEAVGKTVKEAAAKEKASRAIKKALKDKAEKEGRLKEEAGRKKTQREQKAAIKAEQEILKRTESGEQVHKAKKARKVAADRRRNFGGA